jgi:hypothetical protein
MFSTISETYMSSVISGYIRIQRGTNMCGIALVTSLPKPLPKKTPEAPESIQLTPSPRRA